MLLHIGLKSFQKDNYCFHTPVVSLNFQRNIHLMILNSALICKLRLILVLKTRMLLQKGVQKTLSLRNKIIWVLGLRADFLHLTSPLLQWQQQCVVHPNHDIVIGLQFCINARTCYHCISSEVNEVVEFHVQIFDVMYNNGIVFHFFCDFWGNIFWTIFWVIFGFLV